MNSAPIPLRTHFAQHNRRVFGFALITALTALAFWLLLYLASYWLVLLVMTVAVPMDTKMPRSFNRVFFLSAAALCALGGLARWFSPNEFPRDHKSALEIALDFILAVPRMTLAVWGNLRAFQWLNERELQLAWRVLEAIAQAERLPAQSMPLEIPEEKTRNKILLALQLTDLIDTREIQSQTFFVLKAGAAERLAAADEPGKLPPR